METNAIGVRWFSDSLLLSCPIGQTSSIGDILGHVGIVQATFAMNGVFLRGAVNVGEHHHGEHIDYGPALSEAAEAEKKLAGATTRIIITKRLQPAVEETVRPGTPRRAKVCFDPKDGFYFIDFIDILDQSGKKALREHIETALQLRDSPAKSKFQWLAAYYNWRTETAKPIANAASQAFQFDGTQ